jgi:hypothetical protein
MVTVEQSVETSAEKKAETVVEKGIDSIRRLVVDSVASMEDEDEFSAKCGKSSEPAVSVDDE